MKASLRLLLVSWCACTTLACGSSADLDCGPGTQLENDTCELEPNERQDGGVSTSRRNDSNDVNADDQAGVATDAAALPMLLTESTGRCPKDLPGPAMVEVDGPSGPLCVDSTEVTQEQYAEFLVDNPMLESDLVICEENRSLIPGAEPSAGGDCPLSQPFNPEERPQWPVVCVDWCDAEAYCKWAGKRLCGDPDGERTDHPPGVVTGGDFNELVQDLSFGELQYVCSDGGARRYVYEGGVDESRCSAVRIGDVGSSNCEGPEGIHDLAANVSEWTALCLSPDEFGLCAAFGGNTRLTFEFGVEEASRCSTSELLPVRPGRAFLETGIRCCAAID